MDLSTRYLGLDLDHPLMPGASPMVDDLDTVRRLEDAGAAAIVMHSLFEEQIRHEESGAAAHMEAHTFAHGEASSYFPAADRFALGPDEYLGQLARIKEAVAVPVVASLNGTTRGGWLGYASQLEQGGADALELNVYELETDPDQEAADIEIRITEMLRALKSEVKIPVAVKLSYFHTSIANLAKRLSGAGADGLVLFNRFYQPDIDIEELEVLHKLQLSSSAELPLRLRWLAILSGRVATSLAVSGGVHTVQDVVKAIMAGADAVQLVSCLLLRGPDHIGTLLRELAQWLEQHEYDSLAQMRGSMGLDKCPDPRAYERAQYVETLLSWRPQSD